MVGFVWRSLPITEYLNSPEMASAVKSFFSSGGPAKNTPDIWCWKHIENPFGRSVGRYAWSDEEKKIVGVRALMHWRLSAPDGSIINAGRAVDTGTDSGWQGRGIFTQLTKQTVADFRGQGGDVIFNTPNSNSAPGYLKMGWSKIGPVRMYLKVLKPFGFAHALVINRKLRAQGELPDESAFGIGKWPLCSDVLNSDEVGLVIKSHEKSRVSTGVRTFRSDGYLKWRYGSHPHINYRVFSIRDSSGVLAAAVVRANVRFGIKELVISELWARDACIALMSDCLKELAKNTSSDYLIAHFSDHSLERKALRKALFFSAPKSQALDLYARPVSSDALYDLANISGWDLSLGDLELF